MFTGVREPRRGRLLYYDLQSPRADDYVRESVLFIGTKFSNLYTAVDTPARGRVVVCLVFACKYVLGHSRVS